MNKETLPNSFVFQRCRYYGLWPEGNFYGVAPFKMECFAGSELENARFQVWYRTYGNLGNINVAPAQITGDVIEFASLDKTIGFYIGNRKYIEGNEGDRIFQARYERPKQGEVDIYISCVKEDGTLFDIDKLYTSLAPFMPILTMHFSCLVGDLVVPIGRPEGLERSQTASRMAAGEQKQVLVLQPRPHVGGETLQRALNSFSNFAAKVSRADCIEIGLAAKRILAGQQETDLIDRYCDFWEACEFLCRAKKFKPDQRLANMLETSIGVHDSKIKTLIVSPLYDIRKNIVHDAIEDVSRIERATPILEDIALLVFGSRNGFYRNQLIGVFPEYYISVREGVAVPI